MDIFKKFGGMWTIAVAAAVLLGMAVPTASTAADVELEVSATQPEYYAQDRAIWDIYEEQNPGVKIKLFSINEDTESAYQARVAAGDPADIRGLIFPTNDNYKTYVNLNQIGYPNWDIFSYDARSVFEQTNGIKGYAPALNVRQGLFFTFVYYEDFIATTGLDPKSIRNVDDLRGFLAALKPYVEKNNDIEYVLDIGWHPRVWGRWMMEAWGIGLGASKQDFRDLWAGKIQWTDQAKNPFVPAFKLAKEFTDKGYFPAKWWNRAWEQEYEASFISGRSAVAYHGPWIWNKVNAQNPDAKLNGFLFPPNARGEIWQDSITADRGSALYAAKKGGPKWDASLKAFKWWTSPEVIKMRAEAIGFIPALKPQYMKGFKSENPQWVTVIAPAVNGELGKVSFDASLGGQTAAGAFHKSGTPFVIEDNAMAQEIGKYMAGETSLDALLKTLQKRWEFSYGK